MYCVCYSLELKAASHPDVQVIRTNSPSTCVELNLGQKLHVVAPVIAQAMVVCGLWFLVLFGW